MVKDFEDVKNEIQNIVSESIADNAFSMYGLGQDFDGEILFTNIPEKSSIHNLPDSMTIGELKKINAMALDADSFMNKLKNVNSFSINDDELAMSLAKRLFPILTDKDLEVIFSSARDLWRKDSDWIQNIAQLITMTTELKGLWKNE